MKSKLFLESLLKVYVKLEIMHKCSNAIKLSLTVNLYNLASHPYAKTLVSLDFEEVRGQIHAVVSLDIPKTKYSKSSSLHLVWSRTTNSSETHVLA